MLGARWRDAELKVRTLVERNKAFWPQIRNGGQHLWTLEECTGHEGEEKLIQEVDLSGPTLERSSATGGAWGQVQQNKEVEATENRHKGWKANKKSLT